MSYIVQEHALGSAILGGLSLGAMTAFACALQGPSQARALLLASLPGTSEARRSWAVQFAEAIERDGLEQAGARFAWSERARFEPATADLVRRGFLQNAPHAIAHLLRRTAGAMSLLLEQESAIERLELPVLLIAGAHDLDALATSEMLAARLPRARFEVIEGAGHLPNLTHREQFNACLSEFLRLLDQREIQASR
jgi:pimeloyl-ACP methyl ester carboxylesterase